MGNESSQHLKKVLLRVEDMCELHILHFDKRFSEYGIKELLPAYRRHLDECEYKDQNYVVTLRDNLEKTLIPFCYLAKKISFDNDCLLNFNSFSRLDILLKCVYSFHNKNGCVKELRVKMKILAELLDSFETDNANALSSMTYRYVRLLLVLLSIGYKMGVSVMADFLCEQILIYYNLEHKGDFSDVSAMDSRVKSSNRGNSNRRINIDRDAELDNSIDSTTDRRVPRRSVEEREPVSEFEKQAGIRRRRDYEEPVEKKTTSRRTERVNRDVVINMRNFRE